MKAIGSVLPVMAFLALIALFAKGLFLDPHRLPSVKVGQPLPSFKVSTLNDTSMESAQLRKQYTLLNVWASWCGACQEEQGFLMQLAANHVPIYGLNYKDDTGAAKQWLATWGNPYKEVGVDPLGQTAIELGVYGTPETFLINPKGEIIYRHTGIMTETVWKQAFLPKIRSQSNNRATKHA